MATPQSAPVDSRFLDFQIEEGIRPKAIPLRRGRPPRLPPVVMQVGQSFFFPKSERPRIMQAINNTVTRHKGREFLVQRESYGFRCYRLK